VVLVVSFAASLWWSSPLIARADSESLTVLCHNHEDDNGGHGIDMLDPACAAADNTLAVGLDQVLTTIEDTATTTILTGEDTDHDLLYFTISTLPEHGTLMCAGVPCNVDDEVGSTIEGGTLPAVTYTPNPGYLGDDEFDFTASDGSDTSCADPADVANQDATITIHVVAPPTPLNTAPVANAQSALLDKNTSKDIVLTGSDVENDTLAFATTSNPTHGRLMGSGANLTYTPDTNYVGGDSFTFIVNDGSATSTDATVSITINDTTPTETSNGSSGGSLGSSNNNGGGGGTVLGLIGTVYVNPSNGSGSGGFVLGTSTEATDDLPAGCTAYLKDYLHIDGKNNPEEVKKLQKFLNNHLGLTIPVTGVFGPRTLEGVEKFQLSQWERVLKPWVPFGLPSDHTATGYVYKTTKHTINMLSCSAFSEPLPQLP
jgi:hypothetical protein